MEPILSELLMHDMQVLDCLRYQSIFPLKDTIVRVGARRGDAPISPNRPGRPTDPRPRQLRRLLRLRQPRRRWARRAPGRAGGQTGTVTRKSSKFKLRSHML